MVEAPGAACEAAAIGGERELLIGWMMDLHDQGRVSQSFPNSTYTQRPTFLLVCVFKILAFRPPLDLDGRLSPHFKGLFQAFTFLLVKTT